MLNHGKLSTHLTLLSTGLIVLVILSLMRVNGAFQGLELSMLDLLIKVRGLSPENPDSRVTIFEFRDQDIGITKPVKYPISHSQIVNIINEIQTCQPSVIGIDLYQSDVERDANSIKRIRNGTTDLVLSKTIRPPFIEPLPGFSASDNQLVNSYISFSEPVRDLDGDTRRYVLGSYATELREGENKFFLSMGFLLSSLYLRKHGNFNVGNGLIDKYAIRLYQNPGKSIEIPRVIETFGGYLLPKDASRGIQMMLNFRANSAPFNYVSIQDLGRPSLCKATRGKVVLIGFRNAEVHLDAFYSRNPYQSLYRVDINAHAVSQIISKALDNRPLISSIDEIHEWLILLAAWSLGLVICLNYYDSILKLIAIVFITMIGIFVVGLTLLVFWGIWIPAAQILLAFCLLNFLTFFHYIYKNQLLIDFQVQQRKRIIEETFNLIHNGPLQRIAYLIRTAHEGRNASSDMLPQLKEINSELRSLGEELRQESLFADDSFSLGSGHRISASISLDKSLYEVYQNTLERTDLENFRSILFKTVKFDPIEDELLNFEKKKRICLFLEEALVNVGKHAKQASRLKVVGQATSSTYTLCVEDRATVPSVEPTSSRRGYGTTHFLKTQRMLRGNFSRTTLYNSHSQPVGTCCVLSWPLRSPLQQLLARLRATRNKKNSKNVSI
jgi:CHASE2 domain-containing sensor protein/two-component sensor histidine kinase